MQQDHRTTQTRTAARVSHESGFTLLEMMIAVSVFIIAVLIIVSAIINVTEESRKARSMRLAMDNLTVAIESLTRSIREGRNIDCGCTGTTPYQNLPMSPTGTGGATCIRFQVPDFTASPLEFSLDATTGRILRKKGTEAAAYFTSEGLRISQLKFFCNGNTPAEDQPVVHIIMRGIVESPGKSKTASEINMQTMVSVRTPNFTL